MKTKTTHGYKTRTRGNKYNLTPETARVGVQKGKVISGALHLISSSLKFRQPNPFIENETLTPEYSEVLEVGLVTGEYLIVVLFKPLRR